MIHKRWFNDNNIVIKQRAPPIHTYLVFHFFLHSSAVVLRRSSIELDSSDAHTENCCCCWLVGHIREKWGKGAGWWWLSLFPATARLTRSSLSARLSVRHSSSSHRGIRGLRREEKSRLSTLLDCHVDACECVHACVCDDDSSPPSLSRLLLMRDSWRRRLEEKIRNNWLLADWLAAFERAKLRDDHMEHEWEHRDDDGEVFYIIENPTPPRMGEWWWPWWNERRENLKKEGFDVRTTRVENYCDTAASQRLCLTESL